MSHLVILPRTRQQIAAAHEGTLVQTSVKAKLLCLECLGAPPASHPNLREPQKGHFVKFCVYMSKLESSYVTIGTTQPNATDQINTASPNRLLWQVWATGSPGCSSWVCFSSYPLGSSGPLQTSIPKAFEEYLEFIKIYLERTEGQ